MLFLSVSAKLMPSYPREVTMMQYPAGYKVMKSHKFDGRKGDSKEQVRRFLHLMSVFSCDITLLLREFSKFPKDRAYIWYANLKPGSVRYFEQLISLFNSKFFYAEPRFSLAELDCVQQHLGEDLDACIRTFYDRALDCCNTVEEQMRDDVCLLEMIEEYRIFLKNLSLPFFSKLIEAACRTKESV